jgi:hypothetical protein
MMKTIICFCILNLFLDQVSYSQVLHGGSGLVGGDTRLNYSFLSDKNDYPKKSEFEFSPGFGVFVAKNFAIGGSIYVKQSIEKRSKNFEMRSSTTAVGPFMRKYFGSANPKPYLHAEAVFGSNNTESKTSYYGTNTSKDKVSVSIYDLGGGIAVFVHQNISLDFGAYYVWSLSKGKDNDGNPVSSKYTGLIMNIGFNFYFTGSKTEIKK